VLVRDNYVRVFVMGYASYGCTWSLGSLHLAKLCKVYYSVLRILVVDIGSYGKEYLCMCERERV
jgi:hypothetical protein